MRITQCIGLVLACLSCVASSRADGNQTNAPECQANELRRRPSTEWPYGTGEDGIWKRDSTLGQLSKTASGIVVGQVSNIRNVSTNEVQVEDGCYLADMAKAGLLKAVEFIPEKIVLGKISSERVTVWLTVRQDSASVPKNGERVMVFVADGFYDPYECGVHVWGFDRQRAAAKAEKWRQLRINGSDRGMLKLEGEEGAELVTASEEYVTQLRGPKRDRGGYFDFLQSLLFSRIERVRLDARTDMLLLMPSLTTEELEAVAKTEKTDQQIRKYARDIVESRKILPPH